jgi:hypothetical protein
MRLSLRATAAAAVKAFGSDGVKAYNLYAVQRLAADLATMERFAGRWGIPALAEELAEPCQLCQLLLSCKVGVWGKPCVVALGLRVRHICAAAHGICG